MNGRCFDHPDRAGIGICIECRHVVCRECTTQVDGINRCASCLRSRARQSAALAPSHPWGAITVVLALGTLGVLWGFVFLVGKLLARA